MYTGLQGPPGEAALWNIEQLRPLICLLWVVLLWLRACWKRACGVCACRSFPPPRHPLNFGRWGLVCGWETWGHWAAPAPPPQPWFCSCCPAFLLSTI